MKKLFRKIHLWLSVPFGVFITLICFSGSMLVFEKEITEWCRPGLYFVEEAKGQPLPLDELMESVAATLPDSVSVTGVTISPDPERTYQVSLSKPRRASLYVDPYTGEVKGRNERLPFFDTMFHLHRWMLGSAGNGDGISWGKLLVGVSTLMLVVILITGLLMWLTNRKKPLAKSLTISFTRGWPRFWHDLHVAGGIYATIFLLALALTGLTWSFSWYRTGFYRLFGVEASAEAPHGKAEGQQARAQGERGGRPDREGRHGEGEARGGREESRGEAGAQPEERRGRHGRGGHRGEGAEGRHGENTDWHHGRDMEDPDGENAERRHGRYRSPYRHWQKVYEELAQAHPGYRQITLSDGSASVVPEGRNSLRAGDRFDFSPRSGEITDTRPYAGQDKSTKVRGGVYTVHVGSWGGLVTRIITFLAALLGATLPLTGYYLWIRRLLAKGKPRPGQGR